MARTTFDPTSMVATVRRSRFRGTARGPAWMWRTAAISVTVLALAIVVGGFKPVLWNVSPSEPPGVYERTGDAPARGRVIAFRVPAAAFPYADRHLATLHRRPVLKAIAAVSGDTVCTTGDVLVINGRRMAPIQTLDNEGARLPRWRGCGVLPKGEVFVFSDHIPNSFDSRYYGPVAARDIVGVYRRVIALPGDR
jgi:conjugative transfer signal peptidase TraF